MKKLIVIATLVASFSASAALTKDEVILSSQLLTTYTNCGKIMQQIGDAEAEQAFNTKALQISEYVTTNATPKQVNEIVELSQQFTDNFFSNTPKAIMEGCRNLAAQ